MDPLVRLLGVSKKFGSNVALQPTDLDFQSGLTTALIGPSGCGKSTLLRLLIALLTPDSGKITVDGTEVNGANAQQLRRRIGYVIQEGGLFPHLTARANLLLMSRHLGRPVDEMESRLEELCTLSQFPRDALARYPTELSGGQRQRVAIARALVNDPSIILADEPTGNLDSKTGDEIMTLFENLYQRGHTIILVTHEAEIANHARRTVRLRDGLIESDDGGFDGIKNLPVEDPLAADAAVY